MKKLLLVLSILLVSCSADDEHQGAGHDGDGAHQAKHWGYKGDAGPMHWVDIASEFSTCGKGKAQSPIDITGEEEMNLMGLEFHYGSSRDSKVINNGHTIQVNYAPGSYAVIGGKKYDLLQFHFHSPSEHQVHGKHADMVAHLVHKSDDGKLAVVAVLFDKGTENHLLTPIWHAMPKHKGEAVVSEPLDINQLISDKSYYNYVGSLTTPPCTEGVNWNVLTTRVSVSSEQINAFTHIFPLSIRPVQPINNRIIGVRHETGVVSKPLHSVPSHTPAPHEPEAKHESHNTHVATPEHAPHNDHNVGH